MTHTTNFKRILCCLLAVLMLCTCVLRPLEVKAVAVELTLAGLGMLLTLYLVAGGVMFAPTAEPKYKEIGGDFQSWAEKQFTTDEEWAEFAAWTNAFYDFLEDPDAPDDDDFHRYNITASRTVLSALAAWVATAAVQGIEVKEKLSAPDKWLYYNGVLFPTLRNAPDGFGYVTILESYGKIKAYYTPSPCNLMSRTDGTYNYRVPSQPMEYKISYYDQTNSKWGSLGSYTQSSIVNLDTACTIIWSNHDLAAYNDSSKVIFPASAPTSEWESDNYVLLEPTFITDMPALDDGSIDPDEIEKRLPATIDPSRLLYETQKENLNEALTETMANLADGTLSYDDYMSSIRADTTTDPEPEPDPAPGGSGDTEIKSGITKLVDFFTGTTYVKSPMDAIHFTSLLDVFPFNIPAGIYQTINFWNSEATPLVLVFPSLAFVDGKVTGDDFTVDFSEFPGMNKIAALIRAGNLILFAIGLLLITRKVTKW